MKLLIVLLLATATGNQVTDISGTSWIQISGDQDAHPIECPMVLIFEETKYRYTNKCHGGGRNKIVEWGKYSVLPSSIWLEDRRVIVGTRTAFGEDAQTMLLEDFDINGTIMTFHVGKSSFHLKKQK